jgi:hypothetical protein
MISLTLVQADFDPAKAENDIGQWLLNLKKALIILSYNECILLQYPKGE